MYSKIHTVVTYCLVNQVQDDGTLLLTEVPYKTYIKIQQANKGLTGKDRRYFTDEYFEDFDILYHRICEVTWEEYREWDAERHRISRHEQKWEERDYQFVSLYDHVCGDEDAATYEETIPNPNVDTDRDGMMAAELDLLRQDLAAWKPWAVDMLDYYLAGQGRYCTPVLARKYQRSERDVRYWKIRFKAHVKAYCIARGVIVIA